MPRTVTEYSDEELGLNAGWDDHLDPNIRKELREGRVVRREHKEAAKKLEAAERELTLYRAGIPSDKRGQVFAQTYKGKSDPEAVRSAYEELFGPLEGGGAGTGEGDGTEGDPAAKARQIAQAGNEGGGSGNTGPVDLAAAIRGAKTEAEVLEIIRQASIHNPEAHLRLPEE